MVDSVDGSYTKYDLIDDVAKDMPQLKKEAVVQIVNFLIEYICDELEDGTVVYLDGIGKLTPKMRKVPPLHLNIKTEVPEKTGTIAFRQSKVIKRRINKDLK